MNRCEKLRVSASSTKLDDKTLPNFLSKEIHSLMIICENLEEFCFVLLVLKFKKVLKQSNLHLGFASTLSVIELETHSLQS